MTPDEIKKAIRKKKTTQRAIAAKIGRSEMSVSSVIHSGRVSDYIMRGIAKAIGKPHTTVFPEYYLGAPKRSTSKTVRPYIPAKAA
ncbi:MAG: helix-turn-helix domain-containing protein [Deltaproteobacteria bacterium]|nr:helix-turn-helix domain-containing protein [Deltaproteobacteria bacterium]